MLMRFAIGAIILCLAPFGWAQEARFREIAVATLGGAPIDVAEAPQGSPVFAELEGNRVGVLVPTGSVREYSIPTPDSGPMGISYAAANSASCASGFEFWFTESRANRLGRVCYAPNFDFSPNLPSLTFLPEISIPTPNSAPRGIVLGQSGVVWFTEFEGNKVGRASSTGALTEFAIPTSGSGPWGIAFDSVTGMIGFTEFRANKIGRLDPATGVITEFLIPTPNSGPVEIVFSGGNLWFSESGAGKIGRITREGVITEYALSDPASGPHGIERDAAGGVWFTERTAGRVGRAKPDGTIREFALPTASSGPVGISFAPRAFGGPPRLLVAESAADRLAVAEADHVVIVGAGNTGPTGPGVPGPGPWDTEFEVSNPESFEVGVLLSPLGAFPAPCQNPFCGQASLQLPSHGAATRFASSVPRSPSGIETWFVSPRGFDVPTVKARIVNRDVSSLSADLPVVRHSTIAALDPMVLSFPGAEKNAAGARSNLVLTALARTPFSSAQPTAVSVLVEVFSAAGEIQGSGIFSLTVSTTTFLADVVGRLGISELHDGQVRVSKISGDGLLWGILATIREDATLNVSLGVNP